MSFAAQLLQRGSRLKAALALYQLRQRFDKRIERYAPCRRRAAAA